MNLRDTLSSPMLGQLVASGILICFIGYQATTTIADSPFQGLMSFLFLGYNLFGFYIICRWGEEITNQSAKIGEAIYCSGWECGISKLPGVRSTIMFVIARANKPLVLTAGGMYNLSLTSYTSLVKTSYSALTVLLQFRHE
uniref:Odorant receptor n=1 Tax=Heliothis virescens TaxID=7102 RepID=A0A2A4J8F3_HELVI